MHGLHGRLWMHLPHDQILLYSHTELDMKILQLARYNYMLIAIASIELCDKIDMHHAVGDHIESNEMLAIEAISKRRLYSKLSS